MKYSDFISGQAYIRAKKEGIKVILIPQRRDQIVCSHMDWLIEQNKYLRHENNILSNLGEFLIAVVAEKKK